MLDSIKTFFSSRIQAATGQGTGSCAGKSVELATAALLFEVARADYHVQGEELEALAGAVQELFSLDDEACAELIQLAEEEALQATCLYEFTQLVDASFSRDDKIRVVEMLWRIAMCDGVLEKHEEAYVRKIADLLHVSHSQFIQAKHVAAGRYNPEQS